ncbi:YihY/virulence factor BrkB family protein [Pontibacter sp. 172403-2]|uniref:YihY/virulence factor BrkB family protein n=1 Tax=Pontibacter rufus TaxID=2791028 RepID=UPI0018AFAE2F|nr:YihY/virulence factor BrkB family protein [Pontibacter sp. 172403-2]MBF9252883.1 YihY/virulence factor BrkB family protein [Pontibacter sp. 172403-2]
MAKFTIKEVFPLLKTSVSGFTDGNALSLAAALAFNAIFSIPPLLIIIIRAAGVFFGNEVVSGKLADQLSTAIGAGAAEGIQDILKNAKFSGAGGIAFWIGLGTLIFAATTFFATLQQSLNSMWNLKVKPSNSILYMLRERVFSFGIILSIALLLLVSFVISAAISILSGYLTRFIPDAAVWVIKLVDFVVSFGLITILFGLIFKYLPDAIIRWKDTLIGAGVTALLFTVGKFLISWYIGTSDPGSAYGAAGSVIIILIWIYYSSMIVLFGAEFTQQYADRFGQHVRPKLHAVFVEECEVTEDNDDIAKGRPKPKGRFNKE